MTQVNNRPRIFNMQNVHNYAFIYEIWKVYAKFIWTNIHFAFMHIFCLFYANFNFPKHFAYAKSEYPKHIFHLSRWASLISKLSPVALFLWVFLANAELEKNPNIRDNGLSLTPKTTKLINHHIIYCSYFLNISTKSCL